MSRSPAVFFKNMESQCCLLRMYGIFLLKIFPRAVQKFGTVPVLVFTFQEEPQTKKICILYDLASSQKAFEAPQLIIKNRQKSKL